MPLTACPECGAEIHVEEDEVEKGEVIHCDECDASLEVVGLDPIELDLASDGKDEDYFDDEEDEKY